MSETVRVGVGVITHRRSEMFRTLLSSFSAMALPQHAEVVFLFVENAGELSVEAHVDAFRQEVGLPVHLEAEARRGIPMARNRVLSMAQDRDCDFLTFVDDDERVDSDWLVRIIAGITERDLDLVGGPLTIEAADAPLTRWQEGFLSHLQERARKRNTKRASAVSSGQDGQLNIYTNNWCARMETVQRLGLWFDEDRQFTGGSDTKFSRDMARAGARIGWICDASVHDRIPRNRLCAAYHYRRARDQATNYVLLNDCNRWKLMYKSVPRAVGGVFLVALGLPFNLRYAVKGIFRLGAVVGRVRGILGGVSRLYVPSVEYRPH